MRRLRHIDRTHQLIPFAEHCVIQTYRLARSVFQTSVGGLATFKEELPTPRDALIKAGCAKCWEGVQGKKRLTVKKALSNP